MDKNEQEMAELHELSIEMAAREEAIVQEYKRTHALPSRGVIDTPERRALREEEKRRYMEITERYKNAESAGER